MYNISKPLEEELFHCGRQRCASFHPGPGLSRVPLALCVAFFLPRSLYCYHSHSNAAQQGQKHRQPAHKSARAGSRALHAAAGPQDEPGPDGPAGPAKVPVVYLCCCLLMLLCQNLDVVPFTCGERGVCGWRSWALYSLHHFKVIKQLFWLHAKTL